MMPFCGRAEPRDRCFQDGLQQQKKMSISNSSCQRWLLRLHSGDELAAERLWSIYFEKLVHLVNHRLSAKYRHVQEPEDVALNAFADFCQGIKKQQFPSLHGADDLWRLLVGIAINKVRRVIRDQNRIKRGGKFKEFSDFAEASDCKTLLIQVIGREPTVDFAAEIAELYRMLLLQLDDQELCEIAAMKFEGYTNSEIAVKKKPLGADHRTQVAAHPKDLDA